MSKAVCEKEQPRYSFRVSSLALAIHVACVGVITTAMTQQSYAQTLQARSYNIPAGSLATVLNTFAQQSDTTIAIDANQLKGMSSSGLAGQYDLEDGFQTILAATAFRAVKVGNGYILKPAEQSDHTAAFSQSQPIHSPINENIIRLEPITLYGTVSRDVKGQNEVYDADISSVYAGKEQIERYKGAQPADLFKGMVSVYSGDARNSGALDPSIRGIQGPGRVPVTIDGTEQALTVWRGYNGVNNRNYIDPNLIGGLQVIKGPSLTRNVNSGVGGAVVISTLAVDDVLKDGKNFGGEIKVETSNNAVKARKPQLLTGQSIYDNPNYPSIGTDFWGNPMFEPYYDPSLFKEARQHKENNVFSGDDVATRIALAGRTDKFELLAAYAYRNKGNHFAGSRGTEYYNNPSQERFNYVPYLAKVYPGGTEVPNTSLRTESYLVKAAWKPTDDQRLEFGYRDTSVINGEILPSRIAWDSLVQDKTGVPQWPLSEIASKAYNLEYKYQPERSNLIDFYGNVWRTETKSHTYSSGGFPNDTNSNLGIFINSAAANSDNTREGLTLSNKFKLHPTLGLTVGASWQKEKLESDDIYKDPYTTGTFMSFKMAPRAGRREEKEFNLNFDYKPVSWLSLNAGARYQNYWAFDDFLNDRVHAGDTQYSQFKKATELTMAYFTKRPNMTPEAEANLRNNLNELAIAQQWSEERKQHEINKAVYKKRNEIGYKMDDRGKLTKDNNPFLNGTLVEGRDYGYYALQGPGGYEDIDLAETGVQKNKDHGWTPTLSATVNFSPNSRMYMRYSEAYRMPSLFETTIGFSGTQSGFKLEPEHAHNYEVAYVHDLSQFFNSSYADIKLAYYYNETKNAIERSPRLVFSNVDSHTTSGLELQSRFDNGRFFTDFSANYNLKNEVCDETSAMLLGAGTGFSIDSCVDDGFVGGYLVSMATPKYSANLTLGGRFLDQKLEVGTRANYYHKYENPEVKNYSGIEMTYYSNTPLSWNSITTVDAYVNYKLKEDTLFELVGTNLTDEFYIDPLTRSAIAAPGRTVKLSVTHKF
ncbi:TonB-dependent receptor [Acinetobacter rudis]|uniref:TonB-dependent receptor n=1 Tax=Acinetobacter rudis TaxID=632955 RepID=UPI003342D836